MTGVARAVFRALHEGKWLSIEYRNGSDKVTRFWAGIRGLNAKNRSLIVDGLHLHNYTVKEHTLYLDRIQWAEVVEGSFCPRNEALLRDMDNDPRRYDALFGSTANLRVLDYLAACSKLDNTPYRADYQLIERLDESRLQNGVYQLDDGQFRQIVERFQQRTTRKRRPGEPLRLVSLGLNLLSIPTKDGLYVLAYRALYLDVKNRTLRAAEEVTLCREFLLDARQNVTAVQSIRQFLDADDLVLLDDFEKNQERIKDLITAKNPTLGGVDDMPYFVGIGRDCITDLNQQYSGILDLYENDEAPVPLRAFFGELTSRPRRRPAVPLALLDDHVNLDQLLAMNHALRNPLAYVQGPPGTGKTSTILNILVTAFFNEKTVLFASYNNHPIDGVVNKLQSLTFGGQAIPFPILRLGNNDVTEQAIKTMRTLYRQCQNMQIFEATLDRSRKERTVQARRLAELLKRYEQILELQERKEAVERLLEARGQMTFQTDLLGQRDALKRELDKLGAVTTEDALACLDPDFPALYRYLNYTSAKYILRIRDKRNEPLREILESPLSARELVGEFNKYLSKQENLKELLRIFPIIATTCSSAHKLGEPKPLFDMVVMDEASQCNTAVSLVPILRGSSLLLVGDPQQLSPVVVLDRRDNEALRRRYRVAEEYDYLQNSVYKCFLACDALSDEVLLSYHYRCHPKIVSFNNKKYYNNRLHIASQVESDRPLVYLDVPENTTSERNTAPQEVQPILHYLRRYPERSVGIITPFARQRALIRETLRDNQLPDDACGTVHAFQGDEKDVIIFSLALTDRTRQATYNWLKDNKELLNVAVSRARKQLVIVSSQKELDRLHAAAGSSDDLYELVQYTRTNGASVVTEKPAASRALGIKPYSTKTEAAFLENLNHALDNAELYGGRCVVRKEVPISQVFVEDEAGLDLFYTGRFDFVVYQKYGREERPVFAIELDGREHREDPIVQKRDRKKEAICEEHGFQLIRVENSYARRYHYIKDILIRFFKAAR